jgi:hypothetical protein
VHQEQSQDASAKVGVLRVNSGVVGVHAQHSRNRRQLRSIGWPGAQRTTVPPVSTSPSWHPPGWLAHRAACAGALGKEEGQHRLEGEQSEACEAGDHVRASGQRRTRGRTVAGNSAQMSGVCLHQTAPATRTFDPMRKPGQLARTAHTRHALPASNSPLKDGFVLHDERHHASHSTCSMQHSMRQA